MYGIDVSEHSGRVDWATVKQSGKTFAFVRATEGVTVKDTAFSRHWPVIKTYGTIIRGAYHYFHPLTSDPVKQAQEFLKTVGKLQVGDFPPVLDVETTDGAGAGTVVNAMKKWLAEVEKAIQQQTSKKLKPIIYTSPNFWINTLGNPSDFASYPLWIAHYGVDEPWVPGSWGTGNWTIHQYEGDTGNIAGVSGHGDLNKFNLIQPGATGPRVKEIQQRLKAFQKPEFDPGNVDGNYGSRTKSAVMAFQKSKNLLPPDGIIGPKTWVALLWA
jgi:lysozyme